ncbi:MAG TPA: D-alanyl-D-alanine carboxypeptidase/D-alanyl-D-alanine-endopeptidase [Blastocatellia bacterium]|nr:D-alanyl-D-alanine carboxypeptidase/D-alanyl-D-alanine-endopeptidase [Blastocatellia bacterium]
MFNRTLARALVLWLALLPCFAAATLAQTVASQSAQAAAPQADTVEALAARLAAHLAQPRFAPAAWGVKIVSLDTGKTWFEHNPQKYFNPASNAKLYTTALALDRLGADYRIRTSLYSSARPDASGTLKGDLIVYGRGDPTMAASLNGGDYFKGLEPLVDQVVSAGVRRIEGDLIGDESYFATPALGAGWEWDDLQEYYGAEASALNINDNALDLFVKPAERVGLPCRITTGPPSSWITIINRTETAAKETEGRIMVYRPVGENIVYVSGRLPMGGKDFRGSVAVHNPAGLFVTQFKEALVRRGITVAGRTRTADWKYREVTPLELTKLIELGFVESPPLREIVRATLKPSQNLYAQLLLLQVGAQRDAMRGQEHAADGKQSPLPIPAAPEARRTTEERGVEALQDFLAAAGVKKGDVLLEEGSGLSRRDIITPNATVALLSFMSKHRFAEDYRNGLPVAGVDGTLQNRMKGTPAAGNARAKTGTLRYVYALSGYVTTAAGEHLAFSIMLNNYYNAERASAPATTAAASVPRPPAPREDVDAIVIMLASFNGKSQ